MSLPLEVDRYCFVCGPENPEGLHVSSEYGDGKAVLRYNPRAEHQGYTGVAHGGIIAALLDEAMVYAACTLGHWVTTAEMTVRYQKPSPTDRVLEAHAEVVRRQRRLVECRAEMRTAEGTVLAVATAKLMQGRAITQSEQEERAPGAAVENE